MLSSTNRHVRRLYWEEVYASFSHNYSITKTSSCKLKDAWSRSLHSPHIKFGSLFILWSWLSTLRFARSINGWIVLIKVEAIYERSNILILINFIGFGKTHIGKSQWYVVLHAYGSTPNKWLLTFKIPACKSQSNYESFFNWFNTNK